MKIESLKDKTDSLTRILLAVAVLLGALVFLKIGFFVSSSNAMMMAAQADPNQAGADDVKKVLAQTKAVRRRDQEEQPLRSGGCADRTRSAR